MFYLLTEFIYPNLIKNNTIIMQKVNKNLRCVGRGNQTDES